MEWVQPVTDAPRVGTVYLIRGWSGVFSAGIDEMGRQLRARGVTAHVYMPEQYPELAATMVKQYQGMGSRHEPICFIGHSRGCDSSLIISRALEKAGVSVDLIVTLDSVDEKVVPKNVRLCYNYWMPGIFGNSNLLRGIPLTQEPGSTGQLYNYNLDKEYRAWRGDMTDHVSIDDDPNLQRMIVEHVLEVCPERAKWNAPPATSR
jgi:thioesterase domain-containing protein